MRVQGAESHTCPCTYFCRGIHDHLKQELPKIEAKAKEGTARVSEGVKEGARAISEAAKEGARKLSAAGREPGSGTASEGK